MEVRGGGKSSEAEVVSPKTPGPGCQLLPGKEAQEPAAASLLAGRRRCAAAAAQTRSRCPPEGPAGKHGAAHRRQQGAETRGNW